MDPAPSASPTGLAAGLAAAAAGLRLAVTRPAVRRAYAAIVGALWLLTTALQVGGLWLLWHLSAPGADPVGGLAWLALWLLRIGGGLIILLAAPVLAVLAVNLALPMLGERIFLAALDGAAPGLAADLRSRPGRPLLASMAASARRLLRFVALTALAAAVGLVPVAGGLAGPALAAYAGAHLLTRELLDPYFDRAGLDEATSRQILRRTRHALLGFGLPYSLAMAVPLVGPLLFGLAQAAAAALVTRVVAPQARANPAHPAASRAQ